MFSLDGNYLRPFNNSRQLIFNINSVVLIVIMVNMIKCLPEFEHFNSVLEK